MIGLIEIMEIVLAAVIGTSLWDPIEKALKYLYDAIKGALH